MNFIQGLVLTKSLNLHGLAVVSWAMRRKMTQFSDHRRCLFASSCCFLQHRLTSSSLCSFFLPWHHGESGAHGDVHVHDHGPRPTPVLRESLRSSAEELSEGQHLKQFKCQMVKFFFLIKINFKPTLSTRGVVIYFENHPMLR